ncbi:5-formyltetrahydrofolate cyclo-ligase [Clostridiaceae bacterium 35-E11]
MKKDIRQQILHVRKQLTPQAQTEKSKMIFNQLKEFKLYKTAENIMVYIDFRNEVKTDSIIADLISSNKKVIIPICVPKTKDLILSQLLDPSKELEKSTFGVLEPKKEYIRKVDPASIDLVIVPGVAFDRQGYRIGYGAGYYDRFFEKLPKPVPSIAIAFDLQMIPKVPADDFDYPVDYIITETETITCK